MGTEINDEPLENESDNISDDTPEDKDPVSENIDPIEDEGNEEKPDDEQEDDTQEEPSYDPGQAYIVFNYQTEGYCYNPDYPETGPSNEILTINWEDLTGHRIKKQISCEVKFIAEDDHYGSYSDEDTGDIFTLYHAIYNKTTGDIEEDLLEETFPGKCGSYSKAHLQNITGGVGLLPIYYLEISISNCGSYPQYWELGIFSEPDPGNEWKVEMIFTYIPE